MGYRRDKWPFLNSTEYEYKFLGKYGAKGEKRGKRKKPTPEQIKKQNQRNPENRVRRLTKENFDPGDLWMTLKYPAGTRKTLEEVEKDFDLWCSAMRRFWRKHGQPFKYICRKEIGKRGGIHIHVLINRLRDVPDTDMIAQSKWKHGRINFVSIHEAGGYKDLAAYIVKEPTREIEGQLSLFPEEERKKLCNYSTSRNLVRPEPERKVYSQRTVKKLVEQVMKTGQPVPTEGYYIDRDSIRCGVNPYTGMSYLHYTECRIKEIHHREEGG